MARQAGACLVTALLLRGLAFGSGPGHTGQRRATPASNRAFRGRFVAGAFAKGDEGTIVDPDGITYARFQGGTLLESSQEVPEWMQPQKPKPDPERKVAPKQPQEWFIGTVKSYAPAQGYGFIESEDTFTRYGTDVFLHRSQVEDENGARKVSQGERVRFAVDLNKKGRPQARDVQKYVESNAVAPTKTFVGKVKSFSVERGFGFIACEETRSIFGGDIFLHKKQAEEAGIKDNDMVVFSVEVSSKGQPQARKVGKFGSAAQEGAADTVEDMVDFN